LLRGVLLGLGSLACLGAATFVWSAYARVPWSLPGLILVVASAILGVESIRAFRQRGGSN
jgi:hypothetical protein